MVLPVERPDGRVAWRVDKGDVIDVIRRVCRAATPG
jgi:hypothetical protein